MFEFIFDYASKPFLGLTILVRLFGSPDHGSNDPWVADLKFVQAADSVYVHAVVHNGLTPEIRELLESGVVIKITSTFACGAFLKKIERDLQYNPVKRSGCFLSPSGTCGSTFAEDSLSFYFAAIDFYCADVRSVRNMKSLPAKLTVTTSINVEAMAIGEKNLWPAKVFAEFSVPELPQALP